MKNLDKSICLKFRDARRAAGLSQSQLAQEFGCNQSAISMFEQGDGTKLGDDVIERLATKFGLSLAAPAAPAATPVRTTPKTGFCPNPACPSNHAYQVEGRTFFSPHPDECDPVGGKFCVWCGEVLERVCPNCGAPLNPGGVCSVCGKPYIVT